MNCLTLGRNFSTLILGIGLGQAAMAQNPNGLIATRDNVHYVSFSNLAFANAMDSASNTLTLFPTTPAGTSASFTGITFLNLIQNFSMFGSPNVNLTSYVAPSAGNNYTASFSFKTSATGLPNLSFGDTYSYPSASPTQGFSASSIVLSNNSSGDYTLEFKNAGTNQVATGGSYYVDVYFSGNWSSIGSGAGQAMLNAPLNSGWATTKNFVYQPATDTTWFEASNTNYSNGSSPGVDILLTGLPSSAILPPAPTTQSPYALREQVTPNTVGVNNGLAGDLIQLGAYCITFGVGGSQCLQTNPAADASLIATAYNASTFVALSPTPDAINPDHEEAILPYSASWTGPWTIVVANTCQSGCPVGQEYPVYSFSTPSIVGALPVQVPLNVSVSPGQGTPSLPTFTWTEPTSFSSLGLTAGVRVQIWDPTYGVASTPFQIYSSSGTDFGRGQTSYSFTVPASFVTNGQTYSLVSGHTYVLEIQNLVLSNPNSPSTANPNVLSRSRSFFQFQLTNTSILPPGATSVALPIVTPGPTANDPPTYSFNINDVSATTALFIDPPLALGYTYTVGEYDPNFATVTVPAVAGALYLANVNGSPSNVDSGQRLSPNVPYAFQTPGGVSSFTVLGIDPAAALDSANPEAFVTGLTFTTSGTFSGTMAPIAQPAVTEAQPSIAAGGTDTLSVSTAGTDGPYSYQWFIGTSGNTSPGGASVPISGATGATFTTPALSATTNYWVQVTGADGTVFDSNTITVTVTDTSNGVTDGPLPLWAILLLGGSFMGVARWRLKAG